MKKDKVVRNTVLTILSLLSAVAISFLLQSVLLAEPQISDCFIFAVFFVALMTEGYLYGIIAAVISVLFINLVFMPPVFMFDFTNPQNLISSIIILTVAILTGTLTSKLKIQDALQAESERERMKANLLRAVSHDIRTPLTTIYSASSTLLEKRKNLSEDQQSMILQSICEDSRWLVSLVENLLSITRIDSGKVKLIKTSTVLDELIDSVVNKFRKHYPEQRVVVEIPEEVVVIPMDVILIEQVIMNMMENAVLHAEGMTQLILRVFTLGDQAIFEIQDNGCGLNEEKIKHIFDGYFDAQDEITDGKKHNSGIGLSVCATIIRAHDGKISAQNNSDGGTTFRFSLKMEDI